MSDNTIRERTISLTIKECFAATCAIATTLCICVAAVWTLFTYTGERYDELVDRQDRLHKETREFTERMITDKITDSNNQLSTQIGGVSVSITAIQGMIRDQANVVMHQVEKTATNKASLDNVKEKLAEESSENQALVEDVKDLRDAVRDISVVLGTESTMIPSSTGPAGAPYPQIRPAFKPRH